MVDTAILDQIKSDGLLVEGHFAYRSGMHSSGLLDRDRLLTDPSVASRFGYNIAKHYFNDRVETVAAPSIWGSGLAQWVGYFLEPKARVLNATPLSTGELMIAEKVVDLVRDRRVLIVDNLIISGQTVARFAELIGQAGGDVVGIATLWRSVPDRIAGETVYSVLNQKYESYPESECPLCAAGEMPAVDVQY